MEDLIKHREAIQSRLNEIFDYFYENKITKSTNLVDNHGYPRSDLDLYTISNYRNELSRLENDMKTVNEKLSNHLLHHHSKYSTPSQPTANPPSHLQPWSVIDNILTGSSSFSAGLHTNDKIISFGPFTHVTQDNFNQLPQFIKSNGNSPIEVLILRNDNTHLRFTIHPNGSSLG